ncbi:hypothetical protein KP509_28G062300 [Ceratopteris richardii]|uniref:Protein FLUORESCENT IN BLUE LIGHT, chloroplastic n=1 Tax=Ceratopteris richardii TaxID=49495 RepID=A0A8T2RE56_CERRI|nr:hypothetical protein KP509_28G062300 [Ceratopteris richardii]
MATHATPSAFLHPRPAKLPRFSFLSDSCSLSLGIGGAAAHPVRVHLITCSSPSIGMKFHATVCFASLAAVALAGARQALAVEDGSIEAMSLPLSNPEVMYAVLAIEAIALIGAAVGGTLARQRKDELERLNGQLRKINDVLKSKAMMETYAPGLIYAPVGRPLDDTSERENLKRLLKAGKKHLREKNPHLAFEEFKEALPLAQQIGDPIEEKKAVRGLGASCQRQGNYREAIGYHIMVLEISKRTGVSDGNTEAVGSIADCYCELGDLESAQKYYNQYIDKLGTDD